MTKCARSGCAERVTDTMYAACNGCAGFFCDAHLLYCTAHEDQHCEECCDNGTAPARGTTPRWAA